MECRESKNTAGQGGGMQNMLKQAQKMQEEMAAKQAELEGREYTVQAGGGAVTIQINGKKEMIGMQIDPDIVDPDDIETLQDILIAGCNEAIKMVEKTAADEMGKDHRRYGRLPRHGRALSDGRVYRPA